MKWQDLTRGRLRRLAAQWHDPGRGGHTYCLLPGETLPEEATVPEDIATAMKESGTGSILFWSLGDARLVLPPFPVQKSAIYQGWHAGALESLLDRSRFVLVLLLRMGRYSVGVFDGERLVLSKTGTRFVKGRHRKGGSSSARFARRREEQARALFDKACEVLRQIVETNPTHLDHFVLGGDRLTLLALEKRCTYLKQLNAIRIRRILNVEDPSLNVLKAVPRQLYMSRVTTFSPEATGRGAAV